MSEERLIPRCYNLAARQQIITNDFTRSVNVCRTPIIPLVTVSRLQKLKQHQLLFVFLSISIVPITPHALLRVILKGKIEGCQVAGRWSTSCLKYCANIKTIEQLYHVAKDQRALSVLNQ